jgi:hypothetical protein
LLCIVLVLFEIWMIPCFLWLTGKYIGSMENLVEEVNKGFQ